MNILMSLCTKWLLIAHAEFHEEIELIHLWKNILSLVTGYLLITDHFRINNLYHCNFSCSHSLWFYFHSLCVLNMLVPVCSWFTFLLKKVIYECLNNILNTYMSSVLDYHSWTVINLRKNLVVFRVFTKENTAEMLGWNKQRHNT